MAREPAPETFTLLRRSTMCICLAQVFPVSLAVSQVEWEGS
jgi:hypothetical protein